MNTMYTGYTQTEYVKPATKPQLVALRDLLLEYGDKNAAGAVDNVIDILGQVASQELSTNFIENWDFTPLPRNMPDIDFGTIDEIPF